MLSTCSGLYKSWGRWIAFGLCLQDLACNRQTDTETHLSLLSHKSHLLGGVNPGVPALGQYSALPGDCQLWSHTPDHKPVTSPGPKRLNPAWNPTFSAAYTRALCFCPHLAPGAPEGATDPELRGSEGHPPQEAFPYGPFSAPLLSAPSRSRAWVCSRRGPWAQPLLPGPWGGRDIPGMSDGCHPLVTILGVLCPQLQGFLVLVAEVDREIMLHREEDISDYQVSTEAAASAAISLAVSQSACCHIGRAQTHDVNRAHALDVVRSKRGPQSPVCQQTAEKPLFNRQVCWEDGGGNPREHPLGSGCPLGAACLDSLHGSVPSTLLVLGLQRWTDRSGPGKHLCRV